MNKGNRPLSTSKIFLLWAFLSLVIGSSSVLAKSTGFFEKRGPSSAGSEDVCISCIFENAPQKLLSFGKKAFDLALRLGRDEIVAKIDEYGKSRLGYFEEINNTMGWNNSCSNFYNRENPKNWTKEVVYEFVSNSHEALQTLNTIHDSNPLKDFRAICPRYDDMSQYDRGYAWALVLNAVSFFESNCNPESRAKGINGIAAGLLQLDLGKEKQYIDAYVKLAKFDSEASEKTRSKCNRFDSHDPRSSLRCGITMISSLIAARKSLKSPTEQEKDLTIISHHVKQMKSQTIQDWSKYELNIARKNQGYGELDPWQFHIKKYDAVYYNIVLGRIERAKADSELEPGLFDRGSYWEVLRPNVRADRMRQLITAFSYYDPCIRPVHASDPPNRSVFKARSDFIKAQKNGFNVESKLKQSI